MSTLHFTTHINGRSETVFALIADLPNYDQWLPRSRAFGSVAQITPVPVGLGTTYIDSGSSGTMRGSVIDYQPPACIAFEQSMPVKLLLFAATLTLTIRYTLESSGQATHVDQEVSFQPRGVIKVAQPIIMATIRRESGRILL
jgi:uncharacterized protein YndB with AHSA1/START domain